MLLDSTCNSDQGAKEMMNEFVKNLLSVFSLLECSASLSASTKVMSGSLSPVTRGMMMADHLADHLAGHVHEVKVAATELLPSCWNDIRQGLFLFCVMDDQSREDIVCDSLALGGDPSHTVSWLHQVISLIHGLVFV